MANRGRLRALSLSTMGPLRTRQELLDFQDRQLKRLITLSYRHVPFYRRLLDEAGIDPNNFRGLEDLRRIPITSKRDFVSQPVETIVSDTSDVRKLIHRRTNGSTGEPFVVRRSLFEDVLLSCVRLRVLHRMGLRPADKLVSLRIPPAAKSKKVARWMGNLGFYGCEFVDSTQLPEEIMKAIRDLKPDVVGGLGGPIYLASRTLDLKECRTIKPRFFALGGDTLTPGMIDHIERVFEAPVFIVYGSHEFNIIASQCPVGGELHVNEDAVLLEILKKGDRPASPGEGGEVVVTALHSFAQPFIRYKLGDIAVRGTSDCPCGSPCSTIGKLEGRILDRIILPDGQLLSPDRLFFVLEKEAAWVRQYQLSQPRRDLVQLRIVPFKAAELADLKELQRSLQLVVGKGLALEIETVPSISCGPGGKLRLSHSEVLADFLDHKSSQTDDAEPWTR